MQLFYSIDILFVLLTGYLVKASLDAGGFRGVANISLENEALLTIDGFKITCTLASATDIPVTFTWHWDSSEPVKDPQYIFEWNYDKDIGIDGRQNYKSSLTWKSGVSLADKKSVRGAIIYGKGSHGDDATLCPNVTLNIMWKPGNASVSRNPASGNILRDSKLIMTCSGDKGYPIGNVTWKLNGADTTYSVYNTDVITIDEVQAGHDGDWTCYFTNVIGSGNESDIQHIEVKWKPESCTLTVNPDEDYINCTNTLRMFCTCPDTGQPTGQINWFLNGNNKTEMNSSANITLNPVVSQDAGKWECYSKNEIGYGTSSFKTVNVRCPPKDKAELVADRSFVKRGQTVRLECKGDPGSPKDKVLLKLDSNVVGVVIADEENTWNIKPSQNGTWSCLFMNKFGNGNESDGVEIGVLLTYLPPKITIDVTAVSSTIDLESNEIMTTDSDNRGNRNKRTTEHDGTNNYTTITLTGNGKSISTNQSIDISEYTFYALHPDTSYNISVFYHNNFGEGEPAFETFITKPLPILEEPNISRNLLSAVVQMTIDNPDSASEVAISVCSIGETDISNCNTENTTAIAVDFREGVYGTFSKRLVNVTIYDSGVQVFSYGHNIDIALVVIILIVLAAVVLVGVIIVIIIIVIKKKDKGKNKTEKEEEEIIDPYGYSNPNNESRTGTGPGKALNASPVYSVVNKGKPLATIAASPADGPVYSKVDWSKKDNRQSLKGSPMSKKAIDKIMFVQNDGKINMQFEVSKKFTGDIEMDVCRKGGQPSTSKQHVRGTKTVVMVLPIKETSQDKYAINMKFIAKGQIVQEVDLTYPYEQNSVNVTVLNESYVTSGTDVKAQEMPEYSEVNNSKKTKGPEMPTYSEVNKSKKKKKVAEEQPYEDVETKNQSSHNDRSTNSVSPSNAEVAVEGVSHHPPRKGAPKEGVMYAELDLNSSGAPRLLPRLGSKSPAHEPVVYADVRPG